VQVPFNGFGDLRNRAIESCRCDWIFSLDADERCTEAVRDEISACSPARRATTSTAFRAATTSWAAGFAAPAGIRISANRSSFRKGSMRYTLDPVHEGYELLSDKPSARFAMRSGSSPFGTWKKSSEDESILLARGAKAHAQARLDAGAFGHALWAFVKHYIFKVGFIDGWAGFVIAFAYFEVTFYRYAKRYEEVQKWARRPAPR